MSVQSALSFIGAVRDRADLTRRVKALGPTGRLEDIVAIGREVGFEFTVEDLRAAHARDWLLRWIGCTSRPPS